MSDDSVGDSVQKARTCLDPIQVLSPPPLPVFLIVYQEGQKQKRVNFLWPKPAGKCTKQGALMLEGRENRASTA